MQREEAYRKKWALGLSVTLSVLILISFAFYKGYIGFGFDAVMAQKAPKTQVAAVVSADSAPSPLESSKKTLQAAFQEIDKQYQEFKKSISDVLVPFVTGIEVYERE